MTEAVFVDTLRDFTKRKPFLPFVVELLDGRHIVVDYPSVAFSGDTAGFLNEHGELFEFTCDEVQRISLANPQATA